MGKHNQRYSNYDTNLFYNLSFGKSEFKTYIQNISICFTPSEALVLLERAKAIGFRTSTVASLSISLEDVKEVSTHKDIMSSTNSLIHSTERKFTLGQLSESERFQQSIDLWNNVTSFLRDEIISAFQGKHRLNSVYMMALSGARGNLNQVRQLVALRGLIADPTGRVLDIPIRSNLNEGLSLTEYLITCYGSRKGVIDTAIRTAHAGYLTRRLVEIGQSLIIRNKDCQTTNYITLSEMQDTSGNILIPLHLRCLGRVVAKNYDELSLQRNNPINWYHYSLLTHQKVTSLDVRSPLTCENLNGICQLCYGWDLSTYDIVAIGEAIGVLAAQSIGEPGTQLTMRTFHTGGAFSGESSDFILAPNSGFLHYVVQPRGYIVHTRWGIPALFTQSRGVLQIDTGLRLDVPIGTVLYSRENSQVLQGQVLGEQLSLYDFHSESSMIEERVICSVVDGQAVLQQHPATNSQNYQGLKIVHGDVYSFSQNLKFGQNGWAQIGDRFQKNTALVPKIGQSNRIGLYLNTIKGIISQSFYLPIIKNFFTVCTRRAHILYESRSIQLNWNLQTFVNLSDQTILKVSVFDSTIFRFTLTPIVSVKNLWSQIIFNTNNSQFDLYLTENISLLQNSLFKKRSYTIGYYYMSTFYFYSIFDRKHVTLESNLFFKGLPGLLNIGSLIFTNSFFVSQNMNMKNKSSKLLYNSQYQCGWIIRTRLSRFRFRGWAKFLTQYNIFIKPLTAILNLTTITCCDWVLIKPLKFNMQSSQTYLNELVFKKASFASPRLLGYEFPLLNENYKFDLLKSRFYLKPNLFKSKHPDFDSKPSDLNLLLQQQLMIHIESPNMKHIPTFIFDYKKDVRFGWNYVLNLYNYSGINQKYAHDTFNLLEHGQTITKATPISCVWEQTYKGGEVVFMSKDSKSFEGNYNLINYSHLVSLQHLSIGVNKCYIDSFVYEGSSFLNKLCSYSGQIFDISQSGIMFRKVELLSTPQHDSFFVEDGDIVLKGQPLTTFKVQQVRISDITQGLPRVEKVLEGRRLIRRLLTKKWIMAINNISNPNIYKSFSLADVSYFHGYIKNYSTKISLIYFNVMLLLALQVLKEIQMIVLREVQVIYKNQGVDIADKHIEVLLRDLTSRVQIIYAGNTNFLPGELVYPHQLQILSFLVHDMQDSFIENVEIAPIFVGLSEAGRSSSSFLSASSFQNTRKVLTASVINHSADWLRGLKSHVIVGSQIPAGTGSRIIHTLPFDKSGKTQDWRSLQVGLHHFENILAIYL